MSEDWGFATQAVHAGQQVDPTTGARAVPIYQTTSYVFHDADHAGRLFGLQEFGNIYTRIMNPTTDVFEQRLAALEGGAGALATASGQAAITLSILNIAGVGDEIVSSSNLYGGTYNLFHHTFPKLGLNVKFVDPDDPESFKAASSSKTKAFYLEVLGNPRIDVPDLEAITKIAHELGVPVIVDNTFATPYLHQPFKYGVDIVIHSATKFIGGHGSSIGGIIVDSGKFDWANGKFPGLVEPDPSYHGVKFVESFGNLAYILKARVQLLRDLGPSLSPFNAFLFIQGLESLHLRMERHSSNAQAVAEFLNDHPAVSWVYYPGLPGDKYHELAKKYLPRGYGAILAFGVKGGREAGRKIVDSVQLFSLLANVGDSKSLIIHPATTTYQSAVDTGGAVDMVRLSVGVEDIKDIIADLEQALEIATK